MDTPWREDTTVFISYAWGGQFHAKEWIRSDIILNLDWKYRVFWDRDSVGFGQSIDKLIERALAERPLIVFCLCDSDFLSAMSRPGSGLSRELAMLEKHVDQSDVRIVPVILGIDARAALPPVLQGRAYLDLTELHSESIPLGEFLLAATDGSTQAQITHEVQQRLEYHALRKRALYWLQDQGVRFTGSARTHEVFYKGRLLTPPDWMYESPDWSYMIHDDNEDFCPAKGRWFWDHSGPSRAMQALGTAVASVMFLDRLRPELHGAFNSAGSVLAEKVFGYVKSHEPFHVDGEEIIRTLLNSSDGYRVMSRLFPPTSQA
ncbi:toll/interleukin-1 receptor domain-containing protein [Stenotrophomonas sp. GD03908]|uniref:Toll/interleukin-1 receptor domain-containing protein n=1 Tax=Stenotrophomonas maltophilia TaxID=40324 RepID=A0AAJ2TW18_STEMA|nr:MULTISPECIES: toll/interleukin-1 receptor domain-containing protein [Stenotrophomonas]MBH1482625.1 toll/interleukin-1 receptor domain-containing protein [Stenotrophomonas maltophilia]MCU1063948.1 toll/interleukin-1 receptor domain-containing protein [Stenotrophomonas maltophilia]MDH0980970.1 toll/interleukin-1 receptor domain-containing protein [Stenotrophomonas sp. GD03908]MDQ7294142.1 toll/interleukin-1 receptor domain-containing protein [Stenotrophomonas sp. Sm0041]MDZ5765775.1 toll/inte